MQNVAHDIYNIYRKNMGVKKGHFWRKLCQIHDFLVEYLREFETTLNKALSRIPGPRENCWMKISCQGPFNCLITA
jgi:hypothetical protein